MGKGLYGRHTWLLESPVKLLVPSVSRDKNPGVKLGDDQRVIIQWDRDNQQATRGKTAWFLPARLNDW